MTIPTSENILQIKIDREFCLRIFILNVFAVYILTIGVLSAAAYLIQSIGQQQAIYLRL